MPSPTRTSHIFRILLTTALLALASASSSPDSTDLDSRSPDSLGIALSSSELGLRKRANTVAYVNPYTVGGSMLTVAKNTYPANQGEPLNVIVSALSDPKVLKFSEDDGGFLNYMLSTDLSHECLNAQLGESQTANTGQGFVNETQTLRWNFDNQYFGSCIETFEGGLHLRYWPQNSTGAIFMAVSQEAPLALNHIIVYNGYNLGRDWLIGNVTNQTSILPTRNLTNTSSYQGSSYFGNYTYLTKVEYVSGLLQNSSVGVNHNDSVGGDGIYAIDGLVALLTISITDQPTSGAERTMKMMGMPAMLALVGTAVWTMF